MAATDPKRPVTSVQFMTRFLCFLLALSLLGCTGDVTCDGDHESVISAKSLSTERLATLYRDSISLLGTESGIHISPIPRELSDLDPIYVKRIGDSWLDIKLAGCFDHGVFVRADSESGRITLRYGEGPTWGEEILWTDDSS